MVLDVTLLDRAAQTNPVTARLNDVDPCPPDKLVDVSPPGGGPPTKCAKMSADDAIVLPTTGNLHMHVGSCGNFSLACCYVRALVVVHRNLVWSY
jgi:hypothetical protein